MSNLEVKFELIVILLTYILFIFSQPEDHWHALSSHNGSKFEITNEFYGAIFRVRAEKEGRASEWQFSNPVQCVHRKT